MPKTVLTTTSEGKPAGSITSRSQDEHIERELAKRTVKEMRDTVHNASLKAATCAEEIQRIFQYDKAVEILMKD